MNVNQRLVFQQLILKEMRLHTPITTSQIVEKLSTRHTLELEKIGINAHDWDFHQKVLRQLKNLEKLPYGVPFGVDKVKVKGTLHRGRPYDTYIVWDFYAR